MARSLLVFVLFCLSAKGQVLQAILASADAGGPQFVQAPAGVAETTASGRTLSITYATTPKIGNTLLIVSDHNQKAQTLNCTDNQSVPNTYTSLAHEDSAGTARLQVFAAPVVTSVGTFTVTCSWTGGNAQTISLLAAEYKRLSITLDSSQGQEGAGTTYSAPALTTTNAADLLVLASARGGATNYTAGACCTLRAFVYGAGITEGFQDQILSATGTYTPTMTGDSSAWSALAVAIKAQ